LLGIYDLAEIVLKPVFGSLSDRIGPKPVLLGGLVASALASGAFVVARAAARVKATRVIQIGLGQLGSPVWRERASCSRPISWGRRGARPRVAGFFSLAGLRSRFLGGALPIGADSPPRLPGMPPYPLTFIGRAGRQRFASAARWVQRRGVLR
jgi:hypothetical protein